MGIRMWRRALVASLSAVLLAACGQAQSTSGSVSATATPSVPAAASASASASAAPAASPVAAAPLITAVNFSFQPQTLAVPVGTAVTFRNDDGATHTFTANGGAFDSGRVSPGQTFTHTFASAGAFAFHCAIHPSMTGTIAVG
ncbi:MAG TPA: cupredoxin domain-containing protein [Candidatus Limnocylindrales bacterium]|nr:cupredoxin domain-containing protein [Candidatus Limnocylindrales bacterium]